MIKGDDGGSCGSGTVSTGASPCCVCVTSGGVIADGPSVDERLLASSDCRERFGESFRVRFFFLWDVLGAVGGIASVLLLLMLIFAGLPKIKLGSSVVGGPGSRGWIG
jgi:hypothetical protein